MQRGKGGRRFELARWQAASLVNAATQPSKAPHQEVYALLLLLRHQHGAHDTLIALALGDVRQPLCRVAQYQVALLV